VFFNVNQRWKIPTHDLREMPLKLEVDPNQQKVTTPALGKGSRLGILLH
jgi:hypothetical protein